LESSAGVLSTVDMVVQRRDGRRLRDNDDDDDDDESYGPVAVGDHRSGDVAVVNSFRCLRVRHSDQKRRASNAAGPLNANIATAYRPFQLRWPGRDVMDSVKI